VRDAGRPGMLVLSLSIPAPDLSSSFHISTGARLKVPQSGRSVVPLEILLYSRIHCTDHTSVHLFLLLRELIEWNH
jgi:hypothetical protein